MSDRTRMGLRTSAECKHCGETFAYKRYGKGHKWHYDRTQEFCSRSCAAEFQCKGWGTDKNGYLVTNRSNGARRVYRFQHRVVMEQHLGRPLAAHETVHHKNGNRADNRIDNLELWSSRHGKGQRVEEKIDFCKSFLTEYGLTPPAWFIAKALPLAAANDN